jgi:hypothetical protein
LRILAIDGGGLRGIFAAHILHRIEQEFSISWQSDFALIAGTSTGSIIAAGLACGLSAGDLCGFYKDHGKQIFKKRLLCRIGLTASRYDNAYLRNILIDIFGSRKLGEIETPLLIPATDIGNGCVHVLKSKYDGSFYRDPNVLVADAVLASCSAPTYFDPHNIDTYMLADGGLWANNPSLIAAVEAKKRLGATIDELRVFSVGTGIGQKYYSQNRSLFTSLFGWGFATRWGRSKFIDMIVNLQAETAKNILGLLLNEDQILRINFKSDGKLSLDDPGMLADWTSKADKKFTHESAQIASFLNIQKSEGTKC